MPQPTGSEITGHDRVTEQETGDAQVHSMLAGSESQTGNQGPESRASRHQRLPATDGHALQLSGSLAGFMQWGPLATGVPSSSTSHSLSKIFPLYRRDPFSFWLGWCIAESSCFLFQQK